MTASLASLRPKQDPAEKIIRRRAVYFQKGTWPTVIDGQIRSDILEHGQACMVAIIPI